MLKYVKFMIAVPQLVLIVSTLILMRQVKRYLKHLPDDDNGLVKDDKFLMPRLRAMAVNCILIAVLTFIGLVAKIIEFFL